MKICWTYERCADVFETCAANPASCLCDIVRKTVSLDTEAECWTGGETHDAQHGCDGCKGEREEMGDMESGCEGQVVF